MQETYILLNLCFGLKIKVQIDVSIVSVGAPNRLAWLFKCQIDDRYEVLFDTKNSHYLMSEEMESEIFWYKGG